MLAAIACAAAACSFVTSFDGLDDGSPDAGVGSDAGAPTTGGQDSGAPSEDGGDATNADVLSPVVEAGEDAGASDDASDASDAGAIADGSAASDAGFCATLTGSPLFCDDFDETALAAPWDQVTGTGGTVALTTTTFTSPPNAMLVTSLGQQSRIDLCGYKSLKSAPTTGTYTLSFEINVVAPDTSASTSDAILAALELVDPTGYRWALQFEVSYDATAQVIDLDLSENRSFTDGGSQYTSHPVSAMTLPVGTWTRVAMVAIIGSGSESIALGLGSGSNASFSTSTGTSGAYPEILVGGTFAEKSPGGWTVAYDDVFFTAQ